MSAAESLLLPKDAGALPPSDRESLAAEAAQPITVTLSLGDALAVGLTLRAQLAAGDVPSGAVGPVSRVAEQLTAAARAAVKAGGR